jgi:hypothetical protein
MNIVHWLLLFGFFLSTFGEEENFEKHAPFIKELYRRGSLRTARPTFIPTIPFQENSEDSVPHDSLRVRTSFRISDEDQGTTIMRYDARYSAPVNSLDSDTSVADMLCPEHGVYIRRAMYQNSSSTWQTGELIVSGADWKCDENFTGVVYRKILRRPVALRDDIIFIETTPQVTFI